MLPSHTAIFPLHVSNLNIDNITSEKSTISVTSFLMMGIMVRTIGPDMGWDTRWSNVTWNERIGTINHWHNCNRSIDKIRELSTVVVIVAGRQENISNGRSSNLPTVIFIKAMLENVFFCDNILSKLVGECWMLNVKRFSVSRVMS